MRVTCGILLILLLSAQALPQSLPEGSGGSPLRVRGEVIGGKKSVEKGDAVYDLRVRLEFVNAGRKPVILLRGAYGEGEWWPLNRMLARSTRDLADGKAFYAAGTSPGLSGSPSWEALRRSLDQPTPPGDLTQVIPPDGSYPYVVNTFVVVADGERLPDTVWLQLTFQMWPFSLERSAYGTYTFGERLRRRWAKSGTLLIDHVRTEPIRLDLRTIQVSGADL